jgi:hypothetical protein
MPRPEKDRRRLVIEGLPPLEDILRGSVVVRSLRCGKPNCACAQGDGHPATYLSVTLKGGRTEQISLPRTLIPLVRRQVSNYHALWRAIEQISAINRELIRVRREEIRPRRRPPRHSGR